MGQKSGHLHIRFYGDDTLFVFQTMHSLALYRKEHGVKNVKMSQLLTMEEFLSYDKKDDLSLLVCPNNKSMYKLLELLAPRQNPRLNIRLLSESRDFDVSRHIFILWLIRQANIMHDLCQNICERYISLLDTKGLNLLQKCNNMDVIRYAEVEQLIFLSAWRR
jgi:hypothetical protein